jgi:hypothetical protein
MRILNGQLIKVQGDWFQVAVVTATIGNRKNGMDLRGLQSTGTENYLPKSIQ